MSSKNESGFSFCFLPLLQCLAYSWKSVSLLLAEPKYGDQFSKEEETGKGLGE